MSFVAKPNLPCGIVNMVAVGQKYTSLYKPLKDLDISIVQVPYNNCVNPLLAYHADLSVLHTGENRIILSGDAPELKERLLQEGFCVEQSSIRQSEKYPADCALNMCIVNDKVICRTDISDREAIGLRKIINVKQGYAKCSVCVVDEEHIISEDVGICTAAKNAGIECLLISKGAIKLEGFDYGFIGGSSGKLSQDKLMFTGSLQQHPDENRILQYLKDCNVEPVFLTDEPCFDVGSILSLKTNN